MKHRFIQFWPMTALGEMKRLGFTLPGSHVGIRDDQYFMIANHGGLGAMRLNPQPASHGTATRTRYSHARLHRLKQARGRAKLMLRMPAVAYPREVLGALKACPTTNPTSPL